MKKSRYIVGIDLGTTTTSLSYIDTLSEDQRPQGLPLLQWEKEGATIEEMLLPSFCYLAQRKEIKQKKFRFPFYEKSESSLGEGAFVLGRLAQTLQETMPSRVINSAKSWLCHGGVNREDKILPWNSDEIIGESRYSPVEVLSFLLLHLRFYWNEVFAKHSEEYKLEEQDVTITVPASFSEIAINLTVKAALLAGFKEEKIRLIEEPQAAFYFWANELLAEKKKTKLEALKQKLPKIEQEPQSILVCDIGGGTCDFSLFNLSLDEKENQMIPFVIKRVAVSRHILLGGDNLDLKIAALFEESYEEKFKKKLNSKQWAEVVSHVRQIKEKILEKPDQEISEKEIHLSLTGESRNLFTGSQTISLSEKKIRTELLEGFFPLCPKDAVGEVYDEGAIKEWNLPYAKNPSFSHHLAQFLKGRKIHGVLFVGGTLIPQVLRDCLLKLITSWQGEKPAVLNEKVYALSVSKGAADYGHSFLSTDKIKIKAGYPRSLYLEVDRLVDGVSEKNLVCVVPKGFNKRDEAISLEGLDFKLALNKAVSFNLYRAEDERTDVIGALVPLDYKKFSLLAPIETQMKTEKKSKSSVTVEVSLHVELTTLGVLKIFCSDKKESSNKWPLEFNVQESSFHNKDTIGVQSAGSSVFDGEKIEKATEILLSYYGKNPKNKNLEKPKASKILQEIEKILGQAKQEWDLLILRKFLDCLIKHQGARGRSPAHESAWFNLCGYFFRPGYGHSLDSMRIQDLLPIFPQGVKHSDVSQVQNEWWVFWRRISGGLQREQQNKIFAKIFPQLRQKKAGAEMITFLAPAVMCLPAVSGLRKKPVLSSTTSTFSSFQGRLAGSRSAVAVIFLPFTMM